MGEPLIVGVVLAAGRSERMGRPKALLRVGDRTFLEATVAALRAGGCGEVVVVVPGGEGGRALEPEARAAGARPVPNPDRDAEQIDSIRLGLAAAGPDAAAAVVLPVDHPLVRPATVAALVAAHRGRPGAVVRPVHGDRPGHPTLFPRAVWPALDAPDLPRGAESVVESRSTERVDVPVDDDGVVADIDTPAAYARHLGGAP